MSGSQYKYVVLGGGNAAGYAAQQFIKSGGAAGQLAIVGDEPVSGRRRGGAGRRLCRYLPRHSGAGPRMGWAARVWGHAKHKSPHGFFP